MSEIRYGYCDEIAAIVDMNKATIEGGEEMTTNDVVERLNQLENKNAAFKRENEEQKPIVDAAKVICHKNSRNLVTDVVIVNHLAKMPKELYFVLQAAVDALLTAEKKE